MRKKTIILVIFCVFSFIFPLKIVSRNSSTLPQPTINNTISELIQKHDIQNSDAIKRGVSQIAQLWQEPDGDVEAFKVFCLENFIPDPEKKATAFIKISNYMETLFGNLGSISLDLKKIIHLEEGEIHTIDRMFGSYNVSAHWKNDFYKNKIAFYIILNFPNYSLSEKEELGPSWTRLQWAYARLGDIFVSRIPSPLLQKATFISSKAGMYVADYNIYAGHLKNNHNKSLFPKDLKLLSHWNLRDELKSNYNTPKGFQKQKMIYQVMNRIIFQEIPEIVINNNQVEWNPYKNRVYRKGKVIYASREPNTRYQHILNLFKMRQEMDSWYPSTENTAIKRAFDSAKQISQAEVEELFIKLLSSPQVKNTAQLIQKKLKRKLHPFDIWYNGFRGGDSISEEKLDQIIQKKYPTAKHMEKDLINILIKLGFSHKQSEFLSSLIGVDDARGSGHAWGPSMKGKKARLRTRVGQKGMNYKGYNIAVHEFGHNVEQIISMNNVDYYMLNGIPNTAFTEALAFVFQKRDLELLGLESKNPQKNHMMALDTFWNTYEIMGVSLVDMEMWKWLYKNPDATTEELKVAVIKISKDIWNRYYAPVFGIEDQTILAIYAHMIGSPLYLSNYAIGHIIDFQIEEFLKDKKMAPEIWRMFAIGQLTPQQWMKAAVGEKISIEPMLNSVDKALLVLN